MGLIRKILPLKSFVFELVDLASQPDRPGRLSLGLYPFDANGFVSSPVDKYKFPTLSQAIDPPVWQHSTRFTGTRNKIFSVSISKVSFTLSYTKRDKCCAVSG